MNKRIKELIDQTDQSGIPYQAGDSLMTITDRYLEYFAELIVRECAKICIEQNVSNLDLDVIRESGKFTLQDLATKSCGENLSKQIRKHFGVEE